MQPQQKLSGRKIVSGHIAMASSPSPGEGPPPSAGLPGRRFRGRARFLLAPRFRLPSERRSLRARIPPPGSCSRGSRCEPPVGFGSTVRRSRNELLYCPATLTLPGLLRRFMLPSSAPNFVAGPRCPSGGSGSRRPRSCRHVSEFLDDSVSRRWAVRGLPFLPVGCSHSESIKIDELGARTPMPNP